MLDYKAPAPVIAKVLAGVCTLLLVVSTHRDARSQAPSWKTYTDTLLGYQFSFPPDYQIQASGRVFSLQQRDSGTESEFYIEDWTRSVRPGVTPWDFPGLVTERALSACVADGPACSTDCTAQKSEEVPNGHQLRILAITRNAIRTCERGVVRTLAPAYIVDLSRGGTYLLLIIDTWPNRRGVARDVLRAIMATIRRVGP